MHHPKYQKRTVIFLFLMFVSRVMMQDSKLPCQTGSKPRAPTITVDGIVPLPPKPASLGPTLESILGIQVIRFRPNLCCGPRAFSSETSVCCLGKVISTEKRQCCLDGTNVPKESRCMCYPSSSWIIRELERLMDIERLLTSIIENFIVTKDELQKRISSISEHLEILDARASELYALFLNEIDIARNQDPGELDYIISLVLFLNTNEQNETQNTRKTLNGLIEVSQMLRNDETTSNPLQRSKRETTEFGSIETSQPLQDIVRQEIEVTLPETNNRDIIERLILDRNEILNNITRDSNLIEILQGQFDKLLRIQKIMEADRDLLSSIQSLLDSILDQVFSMEAAFIEEQEEFDQEFFEEEFRFKRDIDSNFDEHNKRRADESTLNRLIPNLLPPPLILPGRRGPPTTSTISTNEQVRTTTSIPIVPASSSISTTTKKQQQTIRTGFVRTCDFNAWNVFINDFLTRIDLANLDLRQVNRFGEENPGEVRSLRTSQTEIHFFSSNMAVNNPSNSPTKKRIQESFS